MESASWWEERGSMWRNCAEGCQGVKNGKHFLDVQGSSFVIFPVRKSVIWTGICWQRTQQDVAFGRTYPLSIWHVAFTYCPIVSLKGNAQMPSLMAASCTALSCSSSLGCARLGFLPMVLNCCCWVSVLKVGHYLFSTMAVQWGTPAEMEKTAAGPLSLQYKI